MSDESQSAPARLTCPQCQAALPYYDLTGSWYYGCPHCHAYFEYENEGPPRLIQTFKPTDTPPLLPLGTPGTLDSQAVRVVGYIRRKETASREEWAEYLLLPDEGPCWQLAEFNGHWTLIRPTNESFTEVALHPKVAYVESDGRRYELYNRYQPQTVYAVGEFDWNILADEKMTVSEYISPPDGLVQEKNRAGASWYRSVYKSRRDISAGFGVGDLPGTYGVGALQPSGRDEVWQPLLRFTILMAVLLVVGQLLMSILKPSRNALETTFVVKADSTGSAFKPFISPAFAIHGPAAVSLRFRTNLDNEWVELATTLINEETGRSYELTKALEYYSGVEDGESWSEGNREEEAGLSRIPSGRYHLNIYPTTEAGRQIAVDLTVTENPMLFSNFLMLMIGLLVYPAYQYFQTKHIEQKRWANSDYGPENQ